MDALTANDAAKLLKVSHSTVTRAAAKNGIGLRHGRSYLFVSGDIPKLKKKIVGKVGNPNFCPGNYLGKPRNVSCEIESK